MLVGLEIVVGHGMNLDDKQRKCLRLYINATKKCFFNSVDFVH